ncbi:MAG: thermonuclease family protein [Pseudomonadota bacterium]|nr:thermonuclease family protein [Pseudomonadota bacterium]
MKLLAGVLLVVCACRVLAFGIDGRVVAVLDGDTIDVLDAAHQVYRVRLLSIDAPERGQPFGRRSKDSLSGMVAGAEVNARCSKMEQRPTGQRSRVLCKVYRDGIDINLAQVRAGMAWHYKAFAREQPVDERAVYAQTEQQARIERRGLWVDGEPVAPWDWRRAQREGVLP